MWFVWKIHQCVHERHREREPSNYIPVTYTTFIWLMNLNKTVGLKQRPCLSKVHANAKSLSSHFSSPQHPYLFSLLKQHLHWLLSPKTSNPKLNPVRYIYIIFLTRSGEKALSYLHIPSFTIMLNLQETFKAFLESGKWRSPIIPTLRRVNKKMLQVQG